MKETRLIGVRLTLQEPEELLERIGGWIESDERQIVLSGNVHGYNLAHQIDWLRQMYERAGAVRIDGFGVILGAGLLGDGWVTRFTGAEFIWDLAAFCAQRGHTLYFLGAREGVARRAADRLTERNPALQVVGTHHGYFDKRTGSAENREVIRAVNQVHPDILYIGFGMPRQERWLRENWSDLNATVAITGGAVFDYAAGDLRRPPLWMAAIGLEWLGRLLIEPRKLWRRYLLGNPLYLWRLARQLLTGGAPSHGGEGKANGPR